MESERAQEIAAALAAELGRRFYEAHCEWMLAVFGGEGVVCALWSELKPEQKFPYIEQATFLLETGHIERNHLMKMINHG